MRNYTEVKLEEVVPTGKYLQVVGEVGHNDLLYRTGTGKEIIAETLEHYESKYQIETMEEILATKDVTDYCRIFKLDPNPNPTKLEDKLEVLKDELSELMDVVIDSCWEENWTENEDQSYPQEYIMGRVGTLVEETLYKK